MKRIKVFTKEEEEDFYRKNGLRKKKQVKYNDSGSEEEEEHNHEEDEQIRRKRPRTKLITEEEKDIYRKLRLRKNKQVNYNHNGNEEEEEDQEEENEEKEDQEDDERPCPSAKDTHNHRLEENGCFPVTCGNKKGVLVKEKLLRGEPCIECQGGWFSPAAFEDFGGKGSSKKWKSTIVYEGQPLQALFDKGILITKGYKRRTSESAKPITESNRSTQEAEMQETEDEDSRGDDSEELEGEEDDDCLSSVSKELETTSNVLTPEKMALQNKVKVVIERIPEVNNRRWSSCTELPAEEPQVSPPRDGGISDDGRKKIKRETENIPICSPSAATSPSYTLIRLEELQSARSLAAKDEWERREDDENVEMSRSETGTTENVREVTSNTTALQRDFRHKVSRPTSASTECKAASPCCKDEPATRPQTILTQTAQVEHSSSDMEEDPCSSPRSSTDLDTIGLEKLKREKIKRQIKVLKLQEEYYTLKIKEFKKSN